METVILILRIAPIVIIFAAAWIGVGIYRDLRSLQRQLKDDRPSSKGESHGEES